MSTPIETNTSELREVLNTVYNLPNAMNGGSGEPDLVIVPVENFFFNNPSTNSTSNVSKITFDPAQVVATYTKLIGGQDVKCVLAGTMLLNSYTPPFATTFSTDRVIAYSTDMGHDENCLVVRFITPTSYFFFSGDNGIKNTEYRFRINLDTGAATLTASAMWD